MKTSENLCMLSAMFSLMNEEQKNLVTVSSDHIDVLTAGVDFNKFNIILQMNQTMDVRYIFKAAVGEQGRNFVRGTTRQKLR